MQDFLRTLGRFLLLAMLVLPVGIILWGELGPDAIKSNLKYRRGYPGHLFTRIQEIPEFGKVDILFLGSSHAYRGIDPRYFSLHGVKSFVLGSSGQTPLQAEVLIERYLDQLQPKLVVYDVSPSSFYDGVESSLDILSNDYIDRSSLRLAWRQQHLGVYSTLFYAWYRQLLRRDKHFEENAQKGLDQYISGGYVQRNAGAYQPSPEISREWQVNKGQVERLHQILRNLEAKGIPVLLIRAPVAHALYDSYSNNDYPDSILTTLGLYENLQNKVDLNDSLHFYDARHLNQLGVDRYNEILLDRIRSLDLLQ